MIAWSVMPVLSSNSQRNLMQIARRSLEHFVETGTALSFQPEDPALLDPAACFVTLRKEGQLRGCVGVMTAGKPLFEEVVQMTRAAASEDFRFRPVRPEELREIRIEISVLSPLERIPSWDEIEAGVHGIFVEWQERTGAFLPEVAEEMNWTPEEFVKRCGQEKAHIPEEAWPEAALYRFTTVKIQELVS